MAFTDNFNRANAFLENSLVASNGQLWEFDGQIAEAAGIGSNMLAATTTNSTGTAFFCPDQGSADHYVQGRVKTSANSGPFMCCRLADRSNFVGIRNNGGTLEVYRRVGGTLSSLHASAQGIAVDDILRLECEGTNWRAYKNGVQFPGAAGSGAIGSAGLTSQRQGIVVRTTTQNPWIDDFEAGALGSVPVEGEVDFTEDDDAVAFDTAALVSATASFTEGDDTVAATTQLEISSTAALTEEDDTVSVIIGANLHAIIDLIEDSDIIVSEAALIVLATAEISEDDDLVQMSTLDLVPPPADRISRAQSESRRTEAVNTGSRTDRAVRPAI